MSCFHPRPAFECVNYSTGEVSYSIWHPVKGDRLVRSFFVACQHCSGCRSSYSRTWSIRCWHESLFHKENCFITLTVDDSRMDEVFPGRSLCYEPFQLFIRSLRKRLGISLRFFMCGEYGDKLLRPHYHAILFGWYPSISDRIFYKSTSVGDLYTSKVISKCWPYGFNTVGACTRETAGYVAGYMQKKINGKLKAKWYGNLEPEFAVVSTGGRSGKRGIGFEFYKKFKRDMYDKKDSVTLPGGAMVSVPRFYDKLHAEYHPSHMEKVKKRRSEPDSRRDYENSPARLLVREHIHKSRISRGKRSLH